MKLARRYKIGFNSNKNIVSLEGKLKCKNLNFTYTTVAYFSKDTYEKTDKKLKVPKFKNDKTGICYKYRPYLKSVKDACCIESEEKILTFIMFNPSTAHQYTLDPTVTNCAKLAEDNDYNGVEILNLLNIREPLVKNINIKDKESNKDFEIKPIFKNVVLAWGCRNFNKEVMGYLNNNLEKFLKYHNKETRYFTLETDKTRHPGNQAWSRCGGFKNNAKLITDTKTIFIETNG